jgi:hypothetical protein
VLVRRALSLLAVAAAVACGSSTTQSSPGDNDGGITDDGATPQDGALGPDGAPLGDSGGPWTPRQITCTANGNYKQNWSGTCGTQRWSIKTGTDSGAASVSLMPGITTTTDLARLPAPATIPYNSRVSPTEDTVFALVDVKIQLARLETDSDYHLVLAEGPFTMLGEIPYPGCIRGTSPWACEISRARAYVDNNIGRTVDATGFNPQLVATVVGVGFFDDEHGQTGAAPNNIELHPILGICFGQGCDPLAD